MSDIKRRWDSFTEFVEYVEGETSMKGRRESRDQGEHFTGSKDWDAALKLAREGWNDRANEIYELTEVVRQSIQSQVKDAFALHLDVSGSVPDVARYLSGEPENMIDFIPQTNPVNDKAANILVNLSTSAGTGTDDMIKRGSAIAALVEAIEYSGVSCNLWVESAIKSSRGNKISYLVNVKRAGENIDAAHIAFCIAHPSMFRRLIFSAMEMETGATRREFSVPGCYGYPASMMRGEEIEADIKIERMILGTDPATWILDNLAQMGLLKDSED